MTPFRITPAQAAEEMLDFHSKLKAGAEHVANITDLGVGVTPRDEVYRENKLVLYRYRSRRKNSINPVPVLIVYALVNRPYMTDLQQNRSIIKGLVEAGLVVYLIDWGYPDRADCGLTLTDYINGYLDRCVDIIRDGHNLKQINLLGICQGGVFGLCYSAIRRSKVKNLITMVTPVDFHTPDNLLSRWVRQLDVDLLVDATGNVPGEFLNWIFLSLKPFRLTGQKYVDMVDSLDDRDKAETFMRMEKWIFDSPDQAGETFREFVKEFFQGNGLVAGKIQIGGRRVDLRDVTIPVLNIYAAEDHLVPPSASKALKQHVGTDDYSELEFGGGHIGIYVSARSQREVPAAIGNWLDLRT